MLSQDSSLLIMDAANIPYQHPTSTCPLLPIIYIISSLPLKNNNIKIMPFPLSKLNKPIKSLQPNNKLNKSITT